MLKRKVNFKKLENQIIARRKSNLVKMGNEIITGIILRTQKGLDVNNRKFKSYTKDYAKKKGSTKVNLTNKQQMLNGITFKKIKDGIRVYFGSTAERSKALGNNKKRKFFGLDAKQKKTIAKKLLKI